MTTLIEIDWKDGRKTAVHFTSRTRANAERVLQFAGSDAKVEKATMRSLDYIQEAASAEEAVELITGVRVPAGTFTSK
jgi:hypothetical protein